MHNILVRDHVFCPSFLYVPVGWVGFGDGSFWGRWDVFVCFFVWGSFSYVSNFDSDRKNEQPLKVNDCWSNSFTIFFVNVALT